MKLGAFNINILISFLIALFVTAVIMPSLIPYLIRLKFGQQIQEDGPTWHLSKQGTPTMGGMMFIIGTVSAVFMTEKNNLIEHAAERVADAILKKYEMVKNVTVLLKKPEAPINADFSYVAVEITKTRGE